MRTLAHETPLHIAAQRTSHFGVAWHRSQTARHSDVSRAVELESSSHSTVVVADVVAVVIRTRWANN